MEMGKLYVTTSREKKEIFTCISTLIPKLDMTIYVIRNCSLNENLIPNLIYQSKLYVELKMPSTMRRHTLRHGL